MVVNTFEDLFLLIFVIVISCFMVLKRSEQMLFALLRGSLHNVQPDTFQFEGATDADWMECYDIASRQGVLALAWDGVVSLPLELHPSKQLKFRWAMSVERYEEKHRRYCSAVEHLQQFYASYGIVSVQLKGVGFSSNYNVPHHREGGDIDVFTYSADTSKMGHAQANLLADSLMRQQGIDVDMHGYKHSNFFYGGIPVENHKFLLNVQINRKFMPLLDNLLRKLINPVEVEMYNGEYKILVPSPEFNMLFLSCHAFQHYGSGIALHHLYDWAVLLKNYGLTIPREVNNRKFLRAIAAFSHLCNTYLGTQVNLDSFPDGYENLSGEMLKEILYPVYTKFVPYTNKARIFLYKTRKVLRSAKLANDVFGASVFGRLYESLVAHIKAPETIFSR